MLFFNYKLVLIYRHNVRPNAKYLKLIFNAKLIVVYGLLSRD